MQDSGPLTANQTVTTTTLNVAVQLTTNNAPLNRGIYLQCPSTNAGLLYFGVTGVTTANGFGVAAGGTSVLIPVKDPSTIYVISASANQTVNWFGA